MTDDEMEALLVELREVRAQLCELDRRVTVLEEEAVRRG